MAQIREEQEKNEQTNKLVVLSGVTDGIGEASCYEFINRGYIVAGCSRNKDKIQLLSQKYPHCYFESVDLNTIEPVQQFCNHVISKFGTPFIVINCAGWSASIKTIYEHDENDYNTCMNVNVRAPFLMIQKFLPLMMKENKNNILLTISSGAGIIPIPLGSIYCASKYAVEGMMASCAQELDYNSTLVVASYDPGAIATKMFANAHEKSIEELLKAGMISAETWAKISIPHILSLNNKDHNGKRIETPILLESTKPIMPLLNQKLLNLIQQKPKLIKIESQFVQKTL